MPRAQQLIEQLQLQPHPEGGWYKEVFRSSAQVHSAQVQPEASRPQRDALTSIYFLLEAGQLSRWHRVLSDEVWVHLDGAPIELWSWQPGTPPQCITLGPVGDDTSSRQPQGVVPAGQWQAARPVPHSAAFSLAACMVAPGFDFEDFTLINNDGPEVLAIRRDHPELAVFI